MIKSIEFVNNTTLTLAQIKPRFTGFFGVLFHNNYKVKQDLISNLSEIKNSDFRDFFSSLTTLNTDSLYSTLTSTAGANDLNWQAYFATGNTKYVDSIIGNIKYSKD